MKVRQDKQQAHNDGRWYHRLVEGGLLAAVGVLVLAQTGSPADVTAVLAPMGVLFGAQALKPW